MIGGQEIEAGEGEGPKAAPPPIGEEREGGATQAEGGAERRPESPKNKPLVKVSMEIVSDSEAESSDVSLPGAQTGKRRVSESSMGSLGVPSREKGKTWIQFLCGGAVQNLPDASPNTFPFLTTLQSTPKNLVPDEHIVSKGNEAQNLLPRWVKKGLRSPSID
ncbi:hypothetical protein NHX12_006929 [Muraenolepis orangiensis]|uniref:Uncharacterized protein n=1 Tax=Muraenolepis orangiensis TaxID=630683 RepID=A0A9Q0DSF8_9TELE|nr:hypothetical protein NHX12_006929 [Muraenolepis orangiensis]